MVSSPVVSGQSSCRFEQLTPALRLDLRVEPSKKPVNIDPLRVYGLGPPSPCPTGCDRTRSQQRLPTAAPSPLSAIASLAKADGGPRIAKHSTFLGQPTCGGLGKPLGRDEGEPNRNCRLPLKVGLSLTPRHVLTLSGLRRSLWDGLGRPIGRLRSTKSTMFTGLGTTVRLQHTIAPHPPTLCRTRCAATSSAASNGAILPIANNGDRWR